MNNQPAPIKTSPRAALALVFAVAVSACSTSQPLATVDYVDLDRFMGDWYVIVNIPTFLEKDAFNAIESYSLDDDGSIDTVFTYRKGGFDGELKRYNPRGFIVNHETNAEWGMRFIWPIKADYRIIYLDEDYQVTIIGRNKRDYVWIMAREPIIDATEYARLEAIVAEAGYDLSKIRRVPQKW